MSIGAKPSAAVMQWRSSATPLTGSSSVTAGGPRGATRASAMHHWPMPKTGSQRPTASRFERVRARRGRRLTMRAGELFADLNADDQQALDRDALSSGPLRVGVPGRDAVIQRVNFCLDEVE